MKGRTLLDAFDEIDASMILEAEPVERESGGLKRIRSIRKPLILVAAILLTVTALSISVIAGRTYSDMEPYWNQMFGPEEETGNRNPLAGKMTASVTEPLREELVSRLDEISEVPENVVFTGDSSDVMFRVVGVTGAGNAAYIWLEVTLSDELLAQYHGDPGDISLDYPKHKILDRNTTGGSSIRFLGSKASLLGSSRMTNGEKYATEWSGSAGENGGAQAELVSRPDNTYCFAYRFQASYTKLSGKELTLNIPSLSCRPSYESSEDWAVLAEGPWELKFTMNFTESVLVYHPRVAGERYVCDISDPSRVRMSGGYQLSHALTEVELAYSTVQISPIYLQIDMGCRTNVPRLVARPKQCTLVMADGTELEVNDAGGGSSSSGTSEISDILIKFFFDEPIDHKQVVAVIYAGVTFSLTEDTLQK